MFEWISQVVRALGPLGVALMMFLENVFPPIPSEIIMPLAGFLAARGEMSLSVLVLAGSLGSLAGAAMWYWIGRALGAERLKRLAARHGRWLALCPRDIDRVNDWFARHGTAAVLVGRMVPTVRTLISVPAGVARMPFAPFLLWSALGCLGWTALLAAAGYVLSSGYGLVADWLDPISWAVIAALLGWYLWRVVSFDARQR